MHWIKLVFLLPIGRVERTNFYHHQNWPRIVPKICTRIPPPHNWWGRGPSQTNSHSHRDRVSSLCKFRVDGAWCARCNFPHPLFELLGYFCTPRLGHIPPPLNFITRVFCPFLYVTSPTPEVRRDIRNPQDKIHNCSSWLGAQKLN